MPQLPTFPINSGPDATADAFGGAVATEVRGLGRDIQKVADMYADNEATAARVNHAKNIADWSKKLEEAVVNGADLGKMREQLGEELDKFSATMTTKKGQTAAALNKANLTTMFNQQAAAVEARRAGDRAKLAVHTFDTSNIATLSSNPEFLGTAVEAARAFANGLPGISPTAKDLLFQEQENKYHMTAALTLARLDPNRAREAVAAQKYKLTGEQIQTVLSRADTTENARRAQAAYEHTVAEQKKAQDDEDSRMDFYKKLRAGEATEIDILGDNRLLQRSKEHLVDLMERMSRDTKTNANITDHRVFQQVLARIDAPNSDPKKIRDPGLVWSAYYGRGLSKEDAKFFEDRIMGNRSPDGQTWASGVTEILKRFKPMLDRSTLVNIDAGGAERLSNFARYIETRRQEIVKAGGREWDLLDETSPHFVGKQVRNFMSAAQRLQGNITEDLNRALDPNKRKPLDEIFK